MGYPGPSIKTIEKMLRISREAAQVIKHAMEYNRGPSATLKTADSVIGGFGVEYIPDAEDEGLLYVNMGDTYTPTIVFDRRKARFYATSWGDLVEAQPRRFS